MKKIKHMKNTIQFVFILFTIGILNTGFAQNNCLDFNGTTDYVNCGNGINSQISNQITISAWVYPKFNAYGDRGIVTNYWYDGGIKGGAGLFAWTTSGDNHKWTGFIATQSGSVQQLSSPEEIVLNQWTHVALSYDNNTARLFLNGDEVVTYNCGPGYLEDPINNNSYYIAKHSYSDSYNNCKIDEVQIWNTGLSASEIKQNMYKTLDGDEAGLVAYYQFNESSGTSLPDLTSNNYDGTLTNMDGNEWTGSLTLRNESNCLNFDGSTNYVVLDNADELAGLTSLTVEAWVNSNSTKSWQEVLHRQNNLGSSNSIAFAIYSGTGIYTYINSGTTGAASITAAGVINTNEWMHIAVSWQSSDGATKIYVNGEEVASGNGSTEALSAVGSGNTYLATLSGTTEHFSGNLDEIRIWNDVRTPGELREYMCREIDGSEAGLIGYYAFNQTFGTSLLDISASNNHGTLTNMDDTDWVDSESFTTWTGSTSTAWSITTNWTDGVPSSTDNVGLYDYGNYNPVIPTGQTINHLVLGSGVNAQIDNDKNLTVNGNLYLAGTLTLESTSAGTGSLIVKGENANSGTLSAQRYIAGHSGVAAHGWHFLSSPVSAQAISDFHSVGSGNDFYKWDEATGTWINRTDGTGLNSSFETNFSVGTGYLIANTANATKSFDGNLNVDDVSISGLTKTGTDTYSGWHLIGNPYSSALQWNNGDWTFSNISANCQIWNEASASYTVIEANGYIPSMNGFMVHADVSNASLTIPASARTHNSTNWYKNSQATGDRIVLQAIDTEGQTKQESVIAFDANATENYDPNHDSYFLAGYAPLFYSISQNQKYALNALPVPTDETIIPLGFEKNESSNFTIQLLESTLGQDIYLVDLKLNITQLLNDDSYNFSSESGDVSNRFLIKFNTVGVNEIDPTNEIHSWFFDGRLYISSYNESSQVDIIDISGRILQSAQLEGEGIQNIAVEYPTGVYFVRLTAKGVSKTEKIIIE